MSGPSLSGRIVSAIAAVEGLEEALRVAAQDQAPALTGEAGPWQQLECAADCAMNAASQIRIARSYMRGALLRGAEIP